MATFKVGHRSNTPSNTRLAKMLRAGPPRPERPSKYELGWSPTAVVLRNAWVLPAWKATGMSYSAAAS
jgi:hypothetical protein